MKRSARDLDRQQITHIYTTSVGRLLFDLWTLEGETAQRMLELLGFPVTPAHINIVSHIDVEGIRLTTLARRCRLTKQSVWEALKNLEIHGYIARDKDPTDARATLISWTAKGVDFLRVVCLGIVVREQDLTHRLGLRKASSLKRLLVELRSSYAQRPPDALRLTAEVETRFGRSPTKTSSAKR
jgi:DNA-binding MarR family transcriptional regulator